MVVEEGITVGGHTLREYLEATNHAIAFDELIHLVDHASPTILETILHLHATILHDLHETAGQFREESVSIRGNKRRPPPAGQVPTLVAQWIRRQEPEGPQYHPVVCVAITHLDFVAAYLFHDGNGENRTYSYTCAFCVKGMHQHFSSENGKAAISKRFRQRMLGNTPPW